LKKYSTYYLHGMTVHSEMRLPELLPCHDGAVDAHIRFQAQKHIPLDQENPWRNYFFAPNQVLLNIKDVAKFFIADGKEILIDPYPQASEKTIRLYLLGSSMGCLLHQRRLLPLHANALQYEKEAVMFMGRSGIGKSTLAAAMKDRGYKVLADDVCAIKTFADNKSVIYPGVPQIKLWKEAAHYLKEDVSLLKRILPDEEKYALPIADAYCSQPLPLRSIYLLDFYDGKELKITALSLMEKLVAIKSNTYRKGMVTKMGIAANHLKMSGELAKGTRIRQILRPQNSLKRINELINAIEDDLQ
jgi:hypothetical protein